MSVDLIRYDLLVQDALRGVVRRVLTDVARDGLPGDHHLYVSFDTQAPGVRLSPRLKERYPEEMTVVLQHQFWDLVVTDQFFEVGLSFNGIPERLHIPFAALKGFFDPSVKFGLQFEPMTDDELEDADEEAEEPVAPAPVTPISGARPTSVPSTRTAARSGGAAKEEAGKSDVGKSETGKSDAAKSDSTRTEAKAPKPAPAAKAEPKAEPKPAPAAARAVDASRDAPEGKDGKPAGKSAAAKPSPASKADEGEAEPKDGGTGGAQVVRLDAFRKK
ncbi:SspB family protein [Ancylobacter moscoviensis]